MPAFLDIYLLEAVVNGVLFGGLLALLALGADHCASPGRDLARLVAAVIVEDVDGGAGQRLAEAFDGLRNGRFLVVTGKQHRDLRRLR